MSRVVWLPIVAVAGFLAMAPPASGQARPYIGFVYPAGGQQGTTFAIKLGGQGLDDVDQVLVTGSGVSAKIVEYYRKLGPQEITLLREQLAELKRISKETKGKDQEAEKLITRIESRLAAYVNRPASASISSLVFAELTVASDAEPGERQLRLATPRGVSNPLVFHVGQLPEVTRTPMGTCDFQVLGKEELALRKRPDDEVEQRLTLPCTANGQIASGEVNWYRFEARKGQRLVISAAARSLTPYVADAVPGWFQAVLSVRDAQGREMAYNDDYRFKPDPVIFFDVPEDGEYRFSITDALYRGREDFVYRVSIGQLPFVTNVFPLGGRVGAPGPIQMQGRNLDGAEIAPPAKNAGPGVHAIAANLGGLRSNPVPFVLDTLPEALDKETNDDLKRTQKVDLPVIVNGRIDRPGDWDVFQFSGRAGEKVVAEINARRLDSPLDSILKVTDAAGKLLAMNDDYEDPGNGMNTHHADSWLTVELPADGNYFVHVGDIAFGGGEEFAYRLRISPPQPDFALRVVPSSVSFRGKAPAAVSVYAIRRDGFTGDIKLSLKDPPKGFSSSTVTLPGDKDMARLTVKTGVASTDGPLLLRVEGAAKIGGRDVVREAVPAEDRMQAFLWRHLVTAQDLQALVYDPSYQPPPKRVRSTPLKKPAAKASDAPQPTFTKQQVAGRLRQLKLLYEEWLLTDDFYDRKVAECEAAL